jgi:hypothetical protein
MTRETTPLDIGLGDILTSVLSGLHTSMPGVITAFDPATQTATVQPALKRKYEGEEDAQNLAPIEDVPVYFPGSGDYWITTPVEVDSYVWLIFSERAIDRWLDKGGVVDPAKKRKFALSDCIALAGLNPEPSKLSGFDNSAITIRNRDNDILIKIADSEVLIEAGGGTITINSSTGQVDCNGNLTVDK